MDVNNDEVPTVADNVCVVNDEGPPLTAPVAGETAGVIVLKVEMPKAEAVMGVMLVVEDAFQAG